MSFSDWKRSATILCAPPSLPPPPPGPPCQPSNSRTSSSDLDDSASRSSRLSCATLDMWPTHVGVETTECVPRGTFRAAAAVRALGHVRLDPRRQVLVDDARCFAVHVGTARLIGISCAIDRCSTVTDGGLRARTSARARNLGSGKAWPTHHPLSQTRKRLRRRAIGTVILSATSISTSRSPAGALPDPPPAHRAPRLNGPNERPDAADEQHRSRSNGRVLRRNTLQLSRAPSPLPVLHPLSHAIAGTTPTTRYRRRCR